MLFKYPQIENSDDIFEKNQAKLRGIISEKNKANKNIAVKRNALKAVEHFTKSLFRSFFKLIAVLLLKNKKEITYVSFAIHGGLGDIIRERSVISDIIKMCPNVTIDIYNKKAKRVLQDIKNIRFFLDADLVELTKKKYDIVYVLYRDITDIIFLKKGKKLIDKVLRNIEIYKSMYFCLENKSSLHLVSMLKCRAGVDDINDISLSISYKKLSLEKFGFTKGMKYITFQYGVGDRCDNKDLRCWDSKHWDKLFVILKEWLKDIKIVQVGVSNHGFKDANINIAKKTSLDELCNVLKGSLLHIDTDGACTHIAKALGTKSIVLFGPTPAEYIGYPENINITSSFCSGCHYMENGGKCLLGNGRALCMDSITPEFVAERAIECLKSIE